MPVWFHAAGIIIGAGIMAINTHGNRWKAYALGVAIFGMACFGLGGALA